MTTLTECEHGETDPALCPPCNRTRPRPYGPARRAQYTGGCDGCPEPVRVGQLIRMNGRELRHAECV